MIDQSRRKWFKQSLLASSTLLIGGAVPRSFYNLSSQFDENNEAIRLNWNENPYGPSPKAISAVAEIAKQGHRYPDSKIQTLKAALGSTFSLPLDYFMITAGSTEILSLLGQHAGLAKGEILTPWVSFPTLIRFGESTGASIKKVPLGKDDIIDLDAVFNAISSKTSVIFICNPNNPTSTEVDNNDLKAFCKKVPKNIIVVVDEAYIEYSKLGSDGSMVLLVPELENLVVCRTFSKAYGLAGFRIGYAISQFENIQALRDRHIGFEMSTGMAPVAAALSVLEDDSHMTNGIVKNEKARKIVYDAFDRWGIDYNKSSTNFIYAKSKGFIPNVREKLKEENILITKWQGMMANNIRISLSTVDHMELFVSKVEKYLV